MNFFELTVSLRIFSAERKMIDEEINYDIKAVDAFKSYGKNCVLDGLNMNVQSCTM